MGALTYPIGFMGLFAPVSCDPHDDGILLTFDGQPNGSTTITDYSNYHNVITCNGTAAISTAQAMFGSGSLFIDGDNSNNISTPLTSGSGLDILSQASGDFTIEGWLYIPTSVNASVGYSSNIISLTAVSGFNEFFIYCTPRQFPGHTFFALVTNIPSWQGCGGQLASPITLDAWHHFCIQRISTKGNMYIDGVLVVGNNSDWSAAYSVLSNSKLTMGFQPGYSGNTAPVYLDEIRITKGVARYASSGFVPPTDMFLLPCP